ncbi:MAG: insulinase family protein [Alphaproteobacteria bacterium]|nr:insulinase family protein [Alphaproteobacteria bacterium]
MTRIIAFFALFLTALPAWAIEIQEVKSPGGITAWLVEDHSNPIVAVSFSFLGGSTSDPAGKEGRASLLAATMDEGAGDLDSQAFQGKLEDLAIRLSFSAGRDTFSGTMRTLTRNADDAFDLLRLALTEPRFDAEPVERIRDKMLIDASRALERPRSLLGGAFYKGLFPNDPYGNPADGTRASLAAITVDDLRAFMAERLAKDTLRIGVVGDITPKQLATRLDTVFGGLPETSAPLGLPEVLAEAPGGIFVIDRDIPQSNVFFGHRGIKRDDPDYFVAAVLSEIMGGGFGSRLNEEVREKRGLAYGVYTYLNPFDRSGLFLGGVATDNARVSESLAIIKSEWEKMAAEGPTQEELDLAKSQVKGGFWLRLENSGSIAGTLVAIQRLDLGKNYLENRDGLVEAVTLERAKAMAKTLFQPENLTIGVIGKPANVEATLPTPPIPGREEG